MTLKTSLSLSLCPTMNLNSGAVSPSKSGKMGWESSPCQSGKRSRPAEDELYLDNYHVQKRYLSEVMASSLNGLTVGDCSSEKDKHLPQSSDLMESPCQTGMARTASPFSNIGDELSLDSPMFDDSDESFGYRMGRYHESPQRNPACFPDLRTPCRACKNPPRQHSSSLLPCCSSALFSTVQAAHYPCSQARQWPMDTTETHFPPSPSDACQPTDLRRAALLRSLQARAQLPLSSSCSSSSLVLLDEQGLRNVDMAEEDLSPGPLSFSAITGSEECARELCEYPDNALVSPVHGIFNSQTGRGSGRVRSLHLDPCSSIIPSTLVQDVGLSKTRIPANAYISEDVSVILGKTRVSSLPKPC